MKRPAPKRPTRSGQGSAPARRFLTPPPDGPSHFPFAINRVAFGASSISASCHFNAKPLCGNVQCVKLGIVLAQPPGYPQKKAVAVFCPLSRDSGKRDRCTGLGGVQVRATAREKAVVHILGRLLLLRLCIYRKHKKKTGENFPRRARGAAATPCGALRTDRCTQRRAKAGARRSAAGGD